MTENANTASSNVGQNNNQDSDIASFFRSKSLMSKTISGPNDLPDLLEEESKSVEENNNPNDKEGLHRDDG